MGCLKKLGCLLVIVVIAVIVAFMTRDRWMSKFFARPNAERRAAALPTWQPLTPAGAQRAKAALERLRAPRGPAFTNVAPGDLAAYIVQELSKTLPKSADSIQAAAIGDRLYVRAVIKTSDLGDKSALGPLSMLLGDRERIQFGGTLHIIRPGFAELQVKELTLQELRLPQALIPRLIRQISRGTRPPGLAADGLPLKTPDYIGDVRVSNGQITIYKASP